MLWKLILLLTITPIAELYVLIYLAHRFSIGATLLLILATGVVGGILARSEGLRVLTRIQRKLHDGDVPGNALIEGAMILVAGALLVTPGVLTDTVGFLVLIPFTRHAIRGLLKRWIQRKTEEGRVEIYKQAGFGPISEEPPPGSPPLEDEERDESTRQQ